MQYSARAPRGYGKKKKKKERLLETDDGADRVSGGCTASSPFATPYVRVSLRRCHDG